MNESATVMPSAKFWLKDYPAGVPTEIDPDSVRSLKQLFEDACRDYAARPAFSNMGRTLSYAEIERASRQFGAWLQKDAGLRKGDRVALMMPNVLQYPIAIIGALRAGMTVVNVNPLYTARELEHQLNDSGAEVIVILENFAKTVVEVLPRVPVKHVVLAALGDMLGFKGHIVNLVVRKVKKMVPAFNLP